MIEIKSIIICHQLCWLLLEFLVDGIEQVLASIDGERDLGLVVTIVLSALISTV